MKKKSTQTPPSWWGGGDDVIVCVSGVHTNPNTKPHRSIFGFRKVRFRAPDPPAPSGRSAQTHKTEEVSPKKTFPCGRCLTLQVIQQPGSSPSRRPPPDVCPASRAPPPATGLRRHPLGRQRAGVQIDGRRKASFRSSMR